MSLPIDSYVSGDGTLDDLLHHLLVSVLMLPQLQKLEGLFLGAVSPFYPLYTLCIHFGPRQTVHQDTQPIWYSLGRNSKPEECLFAQGDICRKSDRLTRFTECFHFLQSFQQNKTKPTTKWVWGLSFLWVSMLKWEVWINSFL